MAHFKRRKSRRSIRCSHCTPHRWMGNSVGRHKAKDEREMRDKKRLRDINA